MAINNQIVALELVATGDIIRQVASQLKNNTGKLFKDYARNMYQSSIKRDQLGPLNQRMAQLVREGAAEAYSGIAFKGESYRHLAPPDYGKKRYSNGKMLKALNDASIVNAGYDGMNLFDVEKMDSYARQWYRLNFGADPAVTPQFKYNPFKVGGRGLGFSLGLQEYTPSFPFTIPIGTWSEEFNAGNNFQEGIRPDPARRGFDAFYLIKARGKRVSETQGIVGYRFLDAGVNILNNEYGRELTAVIRQWHEYAKTRRI